MIGAAQVFTVLTEFRFETAGAVAGSNTLHDSIYKLNQAAEATKGTLMAVGAELTGTFGVGFYGIVGTLLKATMASDKFYRTQISIANIMGQSVSNSFDERMGIAAMHMEKINKLANEFALPVDEMTEMAKLTMAMSGFRGKPELAIDITRNFLKAAPILGISPQESMGQFSRMIQGGASMGDPVFQRLISDTSTMKGTKTQAFNAMTEEQRIRMLRTALQEFTKDTKSLEAVVGSLSGQFQILKNQLMGVGSILKPIGDAILPLFVDILKQVNKYLAKEGKKMLSDIGKAIEPFTKNAVDFYATYKGIKALHDAFNMISTMFKGAGMILGIQAVSKMFGVRIPGVSAFIDMIGGLIGFLEKPILGSGVLAEIGTLSRLFWSIGTSMTNLFGITLLFEIAVRATAYAWADFVQRLATTAVPRIIESASKLAIALGILNDGMNTFSKFLGVSIITEIFLVIAEGIAWISEKWVGFMTVFLMGVAGMTTAIMGIGEAIWNAITGKDMESPKVISDSIDLAMQDIFERIHGKIDDGTAVANQTVNMNVNMKNEFKNQMEPDRIAFTIQDQLLKAATNKTQASGMRASGGMNFAGGF